MSSLRDEILIALDTSFEDYDYPSPKGKVSAFELAAEEIMFALQTAVLAMPVLVDEPTAQSLFDDGPPYTDNPTAVRRNELRAEVTKALQQLFESEG